MILSELIDIAKQRAIYDWSMTSAVLATTLNVNRYGGEPVPLNAFVPDFDRTNDDEPEPEVIDDPEVKKQFGEMLRRRFG